MRRVVVCSAVLLAAAVQPTASSATSSDLFAGRPCAFNGVSDPAGDGQQWEGTVYGGPYVVLPGDPAAPVTSVTLTCSLQLDSTDYDAPDLATASSTSGGSTVALPPTQVSVVVPSGHVVAICTELTWTTARGTYTARKDYYPGGEPQCYGSTSDFVPTRGLHSNVGPFG